MVSIRRSTAKPQATKITSGLIDNLTDHLARNTFWLAILSNFTTRLIPNKRRGNRGYAFWEGRRIRSAIAALTDGAADGSLLFVTLTAPADRDPSVAGWKSFAAALGPWIRRIHPAAFLTTIESHLSGHPHAHVVVRLSAPVAWWVDKHGIRRAPDELNAKIRHAWKLGLADVRVADAGAVEYLTKEMGKQTRAVETILRRIKAGEDPTEADKKALLALFWLNDAKLRRIRMSRGLVAETGGGDQTSPEAEDAEPDALISYRNNSTDPVVLAWILVPRHLIGDPWTGPPPLTPPSGSGPSANASAY